MAAASAKPNPNAGMSMSATGRQRLANRERLVLAYYDDGGKGKGNCTFGYGTLVERRPCKPEELKKKVTKEMAENELGKRIKGFECDIRKFVTTSLNQEQFDALTSYVYNVGTSGSQPIFSAINANDFALAATTMKKYIYARQGKKKVLMRGLIARRNEESAPFEESQP